MAWSTRTCQTSHPIPPAAGPGQALRSDSRERPDVMSSAVGPGARPHGRPQGRPQGPPPDGGWGWVVLFGVVITYMTNLALFSVFGLLFGGTLESWGLETTGVAVISSTMTSVQNFTGLVVGPLVKWLGSKRVSLIGGVLVASGLGLSYLASAPWHILITWGFLAGTGLGLLAPSTFLSITSYFSTKRSQAVGIALAGTGMGQIILPHLVRLLLETYGFHGAVLILAGLALHSIPGVLLYRRPTPRRNVLDPESQPLREKPPSPPSPPSSPTPLLSKEKVGYEEPGPGPRPGLGRLVRAMDLDLLWNLRFMNLAIGAGLIYTTMTSFSMIFPFFLMESVGLTASATATCMSVQSGADLVSRLVLPQLMSRRLCKSPPPGGGEEGGGGTKGAGLAARTVMLIGAVGSAASRSAMAELTGYPEIVFMSAVTGFFRGATVLNQNLVVAEHVPAGRLPSAIGMTMVVKGACVLGFGSALGVVRDATGSFPLFIHCLSLLAAIVAVSWLVESMCCCRTSR